MLCSAGFVEDPEEGFHLIPILTQDNQPRFLDWVIMSLCVTACLGAVGVVFHLRFHLNLHAFLVGSPLNDTPQQVPAD